MVSIPASGSVFPPGATLVSHRATDIAGNTTEIFHLVTVAIVLQIDIQPAQLNTEAKGVLPVVIPGSGGIDVSAIDVATVILNQASPAHAGHIEDANDDGIDDLVLHFPVPDIVIDPEAVDGDLVDLTLTGEINGLPFSAEDSVVIKLAKEKPNSDESGSEGDGGGSGNGKGGQK